MILMLESNKIQFKNNICQQLTQRIHTSSACPTRQNNTKFKEKHFFFFGYKVKILLRIFQVLQSKGYFEQRYLACIIN